MVRVLLVDDHELFRQGVRSLLSTKGGFDVVAEAGSVGEAVAMTLDLEPDLVLMDFTLPDGNGLDATRAILRQRPATRIIFLTVHDRDEHLFEAIRAGAYGYLLKNVPAGKLLEFLRGLESGEAAISPSLTTRILHEFARLQPTRHAPHGELVDLTARELEVLRMVSTGSTNQEIAERLFITVNTVKNHVSNIFEKLNVKNRRQAAQYARTRGILQG